MNRVYFVTFLLLIIQNNLFGFTVPEDYLLKTDSLFNCSDKKPKTFVGVFKNENRNVVYYASTTKILGYNVDTVQYHLINVTRYPEYFKFIKKSELINDYKDNSDRDAFFNVAGAAFAKALFIGSIDYAIDSLNGNRKIYYNKVQDVELNKKYFEKEKGILKIEFYEFNMYFTLKKINENETSTLLVGIVAPKIWIPKWLFRMTAYFLYPSILADFEDALNKEYAHYK
jgi:hypothetical protein